MDKREAVLSLAETGQPGDHIPAAFFLHFPPEFHRGQPAVDKHVEYFRATGNDIMKVQYESRYPSRGIDSPRDWKDVPELGADFYRDQIDVVAGVARELGSEAVVVVTLYSAYMFASHFAGWATLDDHMQKDPESVARALQVIAGSMAVFIRACVGAGADGFYVSSQGGETGRFRDPSLFSTWIRPIEMRIWDEIGDAGAGFNILHVCDYEMPYESLEQFMDYPGDIVSAPLELTTGRATGADVAELFGRPFLGGMERLESLSVGSPEDVERDATAALDSGPPAMILGADCTLAASAPWENIRIATDVAHAYRRRSS